MQKTYGGWRGLLIDAKCINDRNKSDFGTDLKQWKVKRTFRFT